MKAVKASDNSYLGERACGQRDQQNFFLFVMLVMVLQVVQNFVPKRLNDALAVLGF